MIVTKSELADELGVSRPRISQFVALGMPVRLDGRVDLQSACEWVLDNLDSEGGRARGHAREWLLLLGRHENRLESRQPRKAAAILRRRA
jgi:phage terminase Nu1 subunit (DNA packaging protein)